MPTNDPVDRFLSARHLITAIPGTTELSYYNGKVHMTVDCFEALSTAATGGRPSVQPDADVWAALDKFKEDQRREKADRLRQERAERYRGAAHVPGDKPVHVHDCGSCVFLGTRSGNGKRYDLYYCPSREESTIPSVIARYGADADYISGLEFISIEPMLAQAFVLALQAGHISTSALRH